MKVNFPLKLTRRRIPLSWVPQICILSQLAIVVGSTACDKVINKCEVQSPLQSRCAIDMKGLHELLLEQCIAIFQKYMVCATVARYDRLQFFLEAFPVFVLRVERGILGVLGVV